MKNNIITIRIKDDSRAKLESLAEEKEITITELVRSSIEKMIEEPKIVPLGEGRYYNTITDHALVNSLEFTELIFWLYDKVLDNRRNEYNIFYIHLLNVIDKVMKSGLFKEEICNELSKVKQELKLCLQDDSIDDFEFPGDNGFDYDELLSALHMIRFNSNNDQFIPY